MNGLNTKVRDNVEEEQCEETGCLNRENGCGFTTYEWVEKKEKLKSNCVEFMGS